MTIPASEIVQVNPGVVGAGGSPLALNGLIVIDNPAAPVGSLLSFGSLAAVQDYFGDTSDEAGLAEIYFLGYDNSTIKPGKLLFARWAQSESAAWLRGGSLAAMTLTELQAVAGVLRLTVDGETVEADINLASATSWSEGAQIIEQALNAVIATNTVRVTWSPLRSAYEIASTATGDTSEVGFADNTGAGAALRLAEATGAVRSAYSAPQAPTECMANVWRSGQNWATFTVLPRTSTEEKREFAEWTNSMNQRILFVAWDDDPRAVEQGATDTFGQIAQELAWDAVLTVYDRPEIAVFALGAIASIDFARTNGRITAAFKTQAGLPITCREQQAAANLIANGYSFYGIYATSNDRFNFLYPGAVSGKWAWVDTYVNQIHLNSQLQLALMTLLTNVTSIPYTEAGYSLIRAAMLDPITAALNFGSIRPGVKLSAQQKAVVNQAAGKDVSQDIEQQGYYLQILDPGAQVRGLRGTPVINFWYTDGGAVQKITLASINIM